LGEVRHQFGTGFVQIVGGMAVKVDWDGDSTSGVLVFRFEGDWNWHECREAMQYAEFLLEDVEQPVSYIYDLTPNRMPQRLYLPVMQKLLNMSMSKVPPMIVVVERGHFVETLKDMLSVAVMDTDFSKIQFTDSLSRARAMIG
jgi:hypothetical protein